MIPKINSGCPVFRTCVSCRTKSCVRVAVISVFQYLDASWVIRAVHQKIANRFSRRDLRLPPRILTGALILRRVAATVAAIFVEQLDPLSHVGVAARKLLVVIGRAQFKDFCNSSQPALPLAEKASDVT